MSTKELGKDSIHSFTQTNCPSHTYRGWVVPLQFDSALLYVQGRRGLILALSPSIWTKWDLQVSLGAPMS